MKSIVPYNINKSLIDPMKKIGADLKGKFAKAAKTPKAPKWTTPAWGKRAAVATIIIVFLLLPSLTGCGKAGNTTGPVVPPKQRTAIIPITWQDMRNWTLPATKQAVSDSLAKRDVNKVILQSNGGWEIVCGGSMISFTGAFKEVFVIDYENVWGDGLIDPMHIRDEDKIYLTDRGFTVIPIYGHTR
ncbi:MAG: hypothetical protein FWE64_01965 [Alphaproteobacteria bacterium]|nr:hypothetical protein [Alphaproteobacteria bacterium]